MKTLAQPPDERVWAKIRRTKNVNFRVQETVKRQPNWDDWLMRYLRSIRGSDEARICLTQLRTMPRCAPNVSDDFWDDVE